VLCARVYNHIDRTAALPLPSRGETFSYLIATALTAMPPPDLGVDPAAIPEWSDDDYDTVCASLVLSLSMAAVAVAVAVAVALAVAVAVADGAVLTAKSSAITTCLSFCPFHCSPHARCSPATLFQSILFRRL
jgi:hypothetical protein